MDLIIKNILHKITNAGYEAYLVGGYPRDYYVGKQSDDYDLATSATVAELKAIFSNIQEEDFKYGKIILQEGEILVEITTYRKEEQYENHRFPKKITFVKNLSEDVLRRDFTMNTLYMNENKEVIDVLDAKKDIDQKLIRTVGDANQKIEEDALRILRAIRFASTFNFQLDILLKDAIKKYKSNLKDISYFRKRQELDRIFTSEYAEYGIKLLIELGLEEELEISSLNGLNVNTSILGIWAQLEFSCKYEFTKKERKDIEILKILLQEDIFDPLILYKNGYYYCGVVAEIKGFLKTQVLKKYRELPIHHRDEISINKKELELLVPIKMISTIYEDLETQILNGNLENIKLFLRKYIIQKYARREE